LVLAMIFLLLVTRLAAGMHATGTKTHYGRIGPQAGSDPSSGVGILRALTPVRSTDQRSGRPEPRAARKNISTRPLGAQLGPSSPQLSVSVRSPPPPGPMMPMRKAPPPMRVNAIRSPRGLH